MPLGTAILLTIINALITRDGFGACLIFGFTLLFSYFGVPIGVVLGFLFNLIISAFTPYEPYKVDKKAQIDNTH